MSGLTSIQWADATWNPTRGCSRISRGCQLCYAERIAARFGTRGTEDVGFDIPASKPTGPAFEGFAEMRNGQPHWTGRVELVESALDWPLRWRGSKQARAEGRPSRIFVNSTSDLFHEKLSDGDIDRVFAVMALAPQHCFQVLTKRPERMLHYLNRQELRDCIDDAAGDFDACHANLDGRWPLPNVWLGVSVEDQETAAKRIPLLLQTPAAVRFVSCEPMLGPVDFKYRLLPQSLRGLWADPPLDLPEHHSLDWVIIGGESGPRARPLDLAWARAVVEQCRKARVAVFFKQGGLSNRCVHDSKGGHLDCFPSDLHVREFPDA